MTSIERFVDGGQIARFHSLHNDLGFLPVVTLQAVNLNCFTVGNDRTDLVDFHFVQLVALSVGHAEQCIKSILHFPRLTKDSANASFNVVACKHTGKEGENLLTIAPLREGGMAKTLAPNYHGTLTVVIAPLLVSCVRKSWPCPTL